MLASWATTPTMVTLVQRPRDPLAVLVATGHDLAGGHRQLRAEDLRRVQPLEPEPLEVALGHRDLARRSGHRQAARGEGDRQLVDLVEVDADDVLHERADAMAVLVPGRA